MLIHFFFVFKGLQNVDKIWCAFFSYWCDFIRAQFERKLCKLIIHVLNRKQSSIFFYLLTKHLSQSPKPMLVVLNFSKFRKCLFSIVISNNT